MWDIFYQVLEDRYFLWYIVNAKNNRLKQYTLVIYLSDTTRDQVYEAADELIQVFRQSAVLIHENMTKTEFYEFYGGE